MPGTFYCQTAKKKLSLFGLFKTMLYILILFILRGLKTNQILMSAFFYFFYFIQHCCYPKTIKKIHWKELLFCMTHFKMGCQPANLTLDCITFYYISYIFFNYFLTSIELYIWCFYCIFQYIRSSKLYVKTVDFCSTLV